MNRAAVRRNIGNVGDLAHRHVEVFRMDFSPEGSRQGNGKIAAAAKPTAEGDGQLAAAHALALEDVALERG